MSDKWIDLEGKVVVVTGGAMGIGEAIVNDLKSCGAYVAIFDRCEPKDYKEEENLIYINLDIRDKDAIEKAVEQVVKKYGTIDALVNNAGVTRPRILVDYYKEQPQYELSEEDFDFMVDINEKGTFLVTQAVTRVLFEKKEGTIINLSSCAGLRAQKDIAAILQQKRPFTHLLYHGQKSWDHLVFVLLALLRIF